MSPTSYRTAPPRDHIISNPLMKICQAFLTLHDPSDIRILQHKLFVRVLTELGLKSLPKEIPFPLWLVA